MRPNKVCPVVWRGCAGNREILAFAHPLAGLQLVKGTIEPGEACLAAALRELAEESGIADAVPARELGVWDAGFQGQVWWFAEVHVPRRLPDAWTHRAADDGGHDFRFFWHRLNAEASDCWHPLFQRTLAQIRQRL